jgi:hypothetical protein
MEGWGAALRVSHICPLPATRANHCRHGARRAARGTGPAQSDLDVGTVLLGANRSVPGDVTCSLD